MERFIDSYSGEKQNESTVTRDIKVFTKNYLKPTPKTNSIEDDVSVLFYELGLLIKLDNDNTNGQTYYKIENTDRESLPIEIILFCILDNDKYSDTITFYELLSGENSVGNIFALNGDGLFQKIQEIVERYPNITYNDDAGVKTLQFKSKPDKWKVLDEYYAK